MVSLIENHISHLLHFTDMSLRALARCDLSQIAKGLLQFHHISTKYKTILSFYIFLFLFITQKADEPFTGA